MKVIRVTPRGYCFGVLNSIKQAKMARKNYPDLPIYLLGYLVHNQSVIDELHGYDITLLFDKSKTKLQLIDMIKTPAVLILSAHGSTQTIKAYAENKNGLIVIDTECTWVTKTKTVIQDHLRANENIVFIGVKKHPETDAILSLSNSIQLITSVADVADLVFPKNPVFVTNQTTLSLLDLATIIEALKTKFNERLVFANDICRATAERQEAILALKDEQIDLLLVVGDSFSNNTNRLVDIGNSISIPTKRISNVDQINPELIKNVETVAVTAGASTPTIIQMAVIKFLENYK